MGNRVYQVETIRGECFGKFNEMQTLIDYLRDNHEGFDERNYYIADDETRVEMDFTAWDALPEEVVDKETKEAMVLQADEWNTDWISLEYEDR